FPEYYANIQHPISLAEISANIAAGSYQDVEAFEADVKLLFENARAYYRKGSLMATAAQELETV
ncbi:Bromodomain-containing protein, partial [Coprinopsis sp. MPI-PUGE-AT-0042]